MPYKPNQKCFRVTEELGLSKWEIKRIKAEAIVCFKLEPDLFLFCKKILEHMASLGKGDAWYVCVRPKKIDNGGWMHRDASILLKMEFTRDCEDYSFNIFKLVSND